MLKTVGFGPMNKVSLLACPYATEKLPKISAYSPVILLFCTTRPILDSADLTGMGDEMICIDRGVLYRVRIAISPWNKSTGPIVLSVTVHEPLADCPPMSSLS